MNYDEFAFFNRQLAEMLRSGLPLEGALRQLVATMRAGARREEIQLLEADLAKGTPLGEALLRRKLPDFLVRLVRLGAEGNDLPGVLTMLGDYYQRRHALCLDAPESAAGLSGHRARGRPFRQLAARLEKGLRFGEALELTPGALPPQAATMLKAGLELGGGAPQVLPGCRRLLRDGGAHVWHAHHYLMLFAFGTSPLWILVFTTLCVFVLPKFQQIGQDMGVVSLGLMGSLLDWSGLSIAGQAMLVLALWLGDGFDTQKFHAQEMVTRWPREGEPVFASHFGTWDAAHYLYLGEVKRSTAVADRSRPPGTWKIPWPKARLSSFHNAR